MIRYTRHLTMQIEDSEFVRRREKARMAVREGFALVNPFDLQPADIRLTDFAASLEKLVRYTGHCRRFYSVAEHSVILSRAVEVFSVAQKCSAELVLELGRQALLHDAHEIYFGDISAPLGNQPECEFLQEAKKQADRVIFGRFGLPVPDEFIERFDKQMVAFEVPQLFSRIEAVWDLTLPWAVRQSFDGLKIEGWMPDGTGARKFLERAGELGLIEAESLRRSEGGRYEQKHQ